MHTYTSAAEAPPPVPEVIHSTARALVLRRGAGLLAGALVLVAALQSVGLWVLHNQPPQAVRVPETTLLHPLAIEE